MGEPSNADIYERLGRMAANMEGLRNDFTVSETRAREHRATVYERFDEISDRTGHLETQMLPAEQARRDASGTPPLAFPEELGSQGSGQHALVLPMEVDRTFEGAAHRPLHVGAERTRRGVHE